MTNITTDEFQKLVDKRTRWVNVTKENEFDIENILAGLYDDPSHFIFELLQNAEDVSAKTISFYLFNDRLEIHHDGEDFDFDDVKAITGIGKSPKKDELNKIGKFGVGFKSVFAITENPEIYSGEYAFRINNFVVPEKLNNSLKSRTKFVLPFDHRIRGTKEVFNLVADRLKNIGETTLLFIENIQEINWFINNEESGKYSRECKAKISDHIRRIELQSQVGNNNIVFNQWLIFDKPVEKPTCQDISSEIIQNFEQKVEVAFSIEVDSKANKELIIPVHNPKLFVFFPTGKETHLKFLIQGPYRTTPARDNIPKDDTWNIKLINETASLVVNSLLKIKELGLLTTDFLKVLPINKENFPEDHMFRPIYEAVLNKLKSDEKLLPANDGSYISAKQAFLASGKDLMDLLNTKQLSLLFGKQDCQWFNSEITQNKTPELWKYLVGELEIKEIEPREFVKYFTEGFIKEQEDEWVIRFYAFLKDKNALWRKKDWNPEGPLRKKPFIRLEKNLHVAPFDGSDKPQAYLPGNSSTAFPKVVKKVIADNKEAREFLNDLRLPEHDLIAEVIEFILPKYQKENIEISNGENLDDVKEIIQALKIAQSDKKEGLVNELKKYKFLIVVNLVLQKKYWYKPNLIYLTERFTGSEILEKYFEGNPDIYFLGELYSAFKREQLLELGCLDNVRVTYRKPNYDGHIDIQDYRGNHKRGLNGFDPDCEIEGLEYALENITVEKARIIWNILKLYHKNIYGIVESSARKDYGDRGTRSHREEKQASKMGKLVREKKWLPDKHGNFHKPSEVALSDLSDNFDFDKESTETKIIAEKLGFKKDIEQELLSQTSEEFRKRFELAKRIPLEKLEKIATEESVQKQFPEQPVANEDHRKAKAHENYKNSPNKEYEKRNRSVRISQEQTDKRTFLREWYQNEDGKVICQICKAPSSFKNRQDKHYFEAVEIVVEKEYDANALALCPLCAAKYTNGERTEDGKIKERLHELYLKRKTMQRFVITIDLCGEQKQIQFVEKHLVDLSPIFEK